MKLWIKLALVIFVITNVVIEIVLFVVKPQVKEHLISLLGEKLKSTAAASAVAISGDEFKKLNFSDPSIINHPAYLHIKNQLSKTKFNLGLKEDIYTLTLINNNTALFGVTTNPKSYSGDTLHLQNINLQNTLNSNNSNPNSNRVNFQDNPNNYNNNNYNTLPEKDFNTDMNSIVRSNLKSRGLIPNNKLNNNHGTTSLNMSNSESADNKEEEFNRKRGILNNIKQQIEMNLNTKAEDVNRRKMDDEKYLNDMRVFYPFGR